MRLVLFVVSAALLPAQWKPLFSGRDLAGWHQCNGTATYRVEGAEIVGETAAGSPNSFLCTDREYGDFILEFETKNDPVLNSGVQIRSHQYAAETEVMTVNRGVRRVKHPAGRVHGYQVEVANEQGGASGGIYDEARRGWLHQTQCGGYKDNAWNTYRVEARGDAIKTWVNGKACADVVDSMDLTGFIALQVHAFKGPHPATVRWRNVRIQDLGTSRWKPFPGGWSATGGGKIAKAKDGTMRLTAEAAKKESRGFYVSKRALDDFTIRLKYKITHGNSGVFYRMGDPDLRGELGYEIEVDPSRDLGGLQAPGTRGWLQHTSDGMFRDHFRPDDWNVLTISAHGRRHTIHVNGVKTAEATDDPGRLNGKVALQLNTRYDLDVTYKDIEILESK
ncbi:MAG: DUF1080 domain-containing protein [Bryobacteraceae bacterium]